MNPFQNISAYKFAPLRDLKERRAHLLEFCKARRIKGTILLSTEGINLFVAGGPAEIGELVEEIRRIPGLESLTPKISESADQPFNRMLVRIKKEIIAFGVEGIDPGRRTSPKLPPQELKRWLDEGRPLTLLDTRNDYEIKLGTFRNALPIGINHFRDFPEAVDRLSPTVGENPVVMFCTGGIRCEKAGPYLESRGYKNVFQLEGGILKYFEECGSAHYDGDCFVFDQRVGVDPSLQETSNSQCFVCLTPLTEIEQRDSRYVEGVSCPFCYRTPTERMNEKIRERNQAFARFARHLPGAEAYDHRRPLKVPVKHEGLTLREFLVRILPHVSPADWESAFSSGRILGPDSNPIAPEHRVRAGDRYFHLMPGLVEPEINVDVKILYEDEVVIVLEKPAPLPVHPSGRFNRNTLQFLLEKVYAPQKPRPAHRLDANTTGLLLVTRTRHFAGMLQPQFADGTIQKKYLARVHGHPSGDAFSCELAIGEETTDVGARWATADGLSAVTHFSVLERFTDGTALLEVRPVTGRTNQIRIHLWELGFPIVGEQLYLPERKLGKTQTGHPDDAPLCLHAQGISFIHPLTKKRMEFESPRVEWSRPH